VENQKLIKKDEGNEKAQAGFEKEKMNVDKSKIKKNAVFEKPLMGIVTGLTYMIYGCKTYDDSHNIKKEDYYRKKTV
jgi:hypothetical protein